MASPRRTATATCRATATASRRHPRPREREPRRGPRRGRMAHGPRGRRRRAGGGRSRDGDEPVFVGIAPTDQVSRYLTGVAHTSVSDVDSWPFDADYDERAVAGEGKPAPPGDQRIWAASVQGAGTQTLEWDVDDGDWSVVVMNADGSRGVDAEVEAGAKVPFLSEIGWTGGRHRSGPPDRRGRTARRWASARRATGPAPARASRRPPPERRPAVASTRWPASPAAARARPACPPRRTRDPRASRPGRRRRRTCRSARGRRG